MKDRYLVPLPCVEPPQSIASRHAWAGHEASPGLHSLDMESYIPGVHGLERICRRSLTDPRLSSGHLFCNKSVSSDAVPTTAAYDDVVIKRGH